MSGVRARWWKWYPGPVQATAHWCSLTTGHTGREDQWWRNPEIRSRFRDSPTKQRSGRNALHEAHTEQLCCFHNHTSLCIWKKGFLPAFSPANSSSWDLLPSVFLVGHCPSWHSPLNLSHLLFIRYLSTPHRAENLPPLCFFTSDATFL